MKAKPLILASLLLAAFVINLDTTIVNVALPTLVRQLHTSNAQLQWVVDAFNLLFAGSVLAAGSLSDRFGRKGLLLAGLAVFGVSSFAGGLMNSSGALIAARAVMGVGAAMIFPSTLSLLTNVFVERQERALAIGLWGAITGVAIALGPIVGGALLEAFDWRSIFFAMAPVATLAAALVAVSVPTSRDPRAPRTDRVGFALSTAMVALTVYTIIEAPNHGWGSARTLASFAIALVLALALVTALGVVDDPELHYASSKAKAEALVAASDLDWTIVRPGGLTNDPGTGRVTVTTDMSVRGRVPREDVARVLAACLGEPGTIGKTFVLVGGDTPVDEAVAAL
jgi:MFS family permease